MVFLGSNSYISPIFTFRVGAFILCHCILELCTFFLLHSFILRVCLGFLEGTGFEYLIVLDLINLWKLIQIDLSKICIIKQAWCFCIQENHVLVWVFPHQRLMFQFFFKQWSEVKDFRPWRIKRAQFNLSENSSMWLYLSFLCVYFLDTMINRAFPLPPFTVWHHFNLAWNHGLTEPNPFLNLLICIIGRSAILVKSVTEISGRQCFYVHTFFKAFLCPWSHLIKLQVQNILNIL